MSEENNKTISTDSDTAKQEENFSELIEKSYTALERLRPGQKVKAKVVNISGGNAYIYLGGKSEGIIDESEFLDEDGTSRINEGDEIDAFFVAVQDGTRKFTTIRHGYSTVSLGGIRDAFEAGVPVSGEVKGEVKAGFEIMIGKVRCFCPASQIDLKGTREAKAYVGQIFPFKILEFGEDGRNIIVSRRALLEEEKQALIARLKETLAVNAEITGVVKSIQKFGAFIDIGGIDGFIPASEISYDRNEKPENILSPGQEIKTKIIKLDWDNDKITLSIKATQPDPWSSVEEKYPAGSKIQGVITRLAPFGAFVKLEPDIEGLIHISNLGTGRRLNHPKEVVEAGQQIEAYVISSEPRNRKLSLSLQPRVASEKIVFPAEGELVKGTVEKIMPYGIFLRLNENLTGLIPNSEMGTPQGTDHKKMFPEGAEMQVVVLEVDRVNGKLRLSRKGIMERTEREEYSQYLDSSKNSVNSSSSLGSLGDLLTAKMAEKKIPGH
ncbi:MAG: S1 RNA-binding domain-containing protein [Thermodesulfovibrionales bacterium]|nr:S1 RNA-binding domain-containing protein [Thermodesulfovibrionales bacterium]